MPAGVAVVRVIVAGCLGGLSLGGCGGEKAEFGGATRCDAWQEMSQADTVRAVQGYLRETGNEVNPKTTELLMGSLGYQCGNQPDATLAEAWRNAHDGRDPKYECGQPMGPRCILISEYEEQRRATSTSAAPVEVDDEEGEFADAVIASDHRDSSKFRISLKQIGWTSTRSDLADAPAGFGYLSFRFRVSNLGPRPVASPQISFARLRLEGITTAQECLATKNRMSDYQPDHPNGPCEV